MKKSVLKIMLGSIMLEAFLVCLFILIGNFDIVAWYALGSVGIIFGYSIPCLFYSKIYDDERYKNIAVCGSIIACIAALICILRLWNLIDGGELLEKIYGTFGIIIWTLAFISEILSYISVNDLLDLFKKVSISLIILLSLFITCIIWTETFPEGFLLRLYYVLIILTVASVICTLILTKIYKKEIEKISQQKMIVFSNNNQTNQNNFISQTNIQKTEDISQQNEIATAHSENISTQTINSTTNTQQDLLIKDELPNKSESNSDINNVL